MDTDNVKTADLPSNFEELKKEAKRTANWRARLQAVEELGAWDTEQANHILRHILADDLVYKVREAAYQQLRKNGEEATAPSKNEGELIKGVRKVLLRIKKSLPKGHTVVEFKEKLKNMRADIYDAYEGELGDEFDQWLEAQWASVDQRR